MAKSYLVTYNRKHDILCSEPIVQFVDKTHVKVVGDISVIVNGTPVYIPSDVSVAKGETQKGKDYAVCLASDGTITVRLYDYDNSTIPSTERILGGFHAICRNVRTNLQKAPVSAFGGALHELAGWSEGDILPKSVWSINFRPTCDDPTGMVYSDGCDRWIDIYNASGTIAAPKSRFGGTRLHTRTATEFMTGYSNVGKWLLTDESFWYASVGSNCRTRVAGAARPSPDTTGGHMDEASTAYPMISSIGCEECCGLQAQWLGDYTGWSNGSQSGSWDYPVNPTKAFGGDDNAFGIHYYMEFFKAVFAGGSWVSSLSESCGPLYRSAALSRSGLDVSVGGRGSSRSTHPSANP